MSRILPLLNTWALNEYVNITLAKIINIIPDLTEQILNQIQILKEPKLLFDSLDKVIKAMPVQKAFIFLKEIIINPNAEYRIRYEATEMVIDILKISHNLAYELFIFLKKNL